MTSMFLVDGDWGSSQGGLSCLQIVVDVLFWFKRLVGSVVLYSRGGGVPLVACILEAL